MEKHKPRTCRICKKCRLLNTHRICWQCEPEWRNRIDRKNQLKEKLSTAYIALAREYGEGCMVCAKQSLTKRMNVDHCHKTGRIRGLLCFTCNYGLRWFQDDPELLRAAADYLERFQETEVIT